MIIRSHLVYLVPSKFLSLLAHLTMVIITLCSKDALIHASEHPDKTDDSEYLEMNSTLQRGLILAISMLAVELVILLYGVTFFMYFVTTIEIILHVVGTIMLSLSIMESWHVDNFWWIFWIGSATPFTLEISASAKHFIQNH